jgi:hypothetical protein
MLMDELKIKDNSKGYAPFHISLSKDKHVVDEVIIHDSITVEAIKLGVGKNTHFDILHHRTRFFLLHTLVAPFVGGPIDESSIGGDIRATLKSWKQNQQPTSTTPSKTPYMHQNSVNGMPQRNNINT